MNILFVLSRDAENLSLVKLYEELEKRGHNITIYTEYNNKLDLYAFHNIKKDIKIITNEADIKLNKYNCIITGRNCFDSSLGTKLIKFNGLIIADNTPFYEENCVYGDIILTAGKYGADNIPLFLKSSIILVGCIKADYTIYNDLR